MFRDQNAEGVDDNHSEDKADGIAGHQIIAVNIACNQMGGGDSHCPQHKNIDYSGETDFPKPVCKADNAVESCRSCGI